MPIPLGTDLSQGSARREPAPTVKRKKRKEEEPVVRPQVVTVEVQMRNLSTAYRNLHGSFPSPSQAMSMLTSATGMPKTVEDWTDFLVPGVKSGEWPLPGDAEAEVAKRESAVDWDNISKPIPTDIVHGGAAERYLHLPYVDAATEADEWISPDLTPQVDPEMLATSFDRIKSIAREADAAATDWDRRRIDYRYSITDMKKELNERSKKFGVGVDYDDTSDEMEGGLVRAFKDHAIMRQYPYMVLGDEEMSAKARDALAALGVDDAALAKLEALRDGISAMDYPDEELMGQLYGAFQFGRPMGQTERKARADFANLWGMENLPAKDRAAYMRDTKTLYDYADALAVPFRAIGDAAGWVHEHINPIDQLSEQLAIHGPGKVGEVGELIHTMNDAAFDVGAFLITGEAYGVVIPKAEQAAVCAYTMAQLMTGGEWVDGQVVTPDPEGLQKYVPVPLTIKPEVLVNANAWAESWRSGEGRMIVERAAQDMAPMFGLDPNDGSVKWATTLGDFALMLWAGAKADVAMWRGAGAAARGAYGAARTTDAAARAGLARLRVISKDPRLTELKALLLEQDGYIDLGKRVKTKDVADEVRALEAERADILGRHRDAVGTMTEDADIYRRIKELGIKREGNDYWDSSRGIANQGAFRGTIKKNGKAMDELARIIESEFPGTTIHNADDLFEFLQGYRGARTTPGRRTARTPRDVGPRLVEARTKVESADDVDSVVDDLFGKGDPDIDISEVRGMFADEELSGEPLRKFVLDAIDRKLKDIDLQDPKAALARVEEIDALLVERLAGEGALPEVKTRSLTQILGGGAKPGDRVEFRAFDDGGSPYTGRGVVERIDDDPLPTAFVKMDNGEVAKVNPLDPDTRVIKLTHEEGVAGQQALTVPGEKLKETQMDMGLEGGTRAAKAEAIPEQMPGQTDIGAGGYTGRGWQERIAKDYPDELAEAQGDILRRTKAEDKVEMAERVYGAGSKELADARHELNGIIVELGEKWGGAGESLIPHAMVKSRLDGGAPPKAPPPETPPPVAKPPVEPPVVGPAGRPSRLLMNRAEVITFMTRPGMGHEYLVRRIFRIPEGDEYKPLVKALVEEQVSVERNLETIEQIRQLGGVRSSFDPTAPGLFDLSKLNAYTHGLKGHGATRVMGTPIGLRRIIADKNADDAVFDFAYATKLGKKKMTDDDARQVLDFADRMYHARGLERQDIIDELEALIKANMEAEGTWTKFEKYQATIRKLRGKASDEAFHGRAYGGHRVQPLQPLKPWYAKRKAAEEHLAGLAADDATRATYTAAIKEADEFIDQYRKASDIVNGRVKASPSKMEEAQALIDNLSSPQPLWGGQLQKNLRFSNDPRLLTWFQSGITARASTKLDALILDRVMRMWKMLVMSRLGFPIRVFGGDEGIRLIAEGVIPFTPKWFRTTELSHKLKGGPKNLSKAERAEYKELEALDDLDDVQMARKAELEDAMKPLLTEGEMAHLNEGQIMDWAERLSDDWVPLSRAHGARYFKALRPHLNMLSREPVVKMYLSRKKPPKDRDGIRVWLEERLLSESKAGTEFRTLLARTGRITAKQMDPKELRKLLLSDSKTGAAANLRNLLTDQTDVLFRIASDDNLMAAVRSGGKVPTNVLSRISDKALDGWTVPGKAVLADEKAWWLRPVSAYYENVTMRLMEGASNGLRDVMFSHGYETALDDILRANPRIDPKVAHAAAVDRAFRYVDSRTFVRNPTIFEDLTRNHILFLNSYRQFWKYWLMTTAKHPIAMSAAYQFHPQRGQLAQELGPIDAYFGASPFWVPLTEEDEGLSGMLANQAPGVGNPFFIGLVGNLLASRGTGDLSKLPFMAGTNTALAPLNTLTPIIYGLTGTNPMGAMGGDIEKYDRQHWELLKAYTDPKTGETDWPLLLDIFKQAEKLPFADNVKPELIFQSVARQFGPATVRWRGESREVVQGYFDTKTMTPEEVNAYRDKHPNFDIVMMAQETKDPDRRYELLRQHPWAIPYVTSVYDYTDADTTITMSDFVEQRESGQIKRLTEEKWLKKVHDRYLAVVGDKDHPSVSDVKAAEQKLTADLKRARTWAERVAKDLSGGSDGYYKQLMSEWEGLDPDRGRLPKLFQSIAEREARQKGEDPDLYVRRLIPALIRSDYEDVYGNAGGFYMYEPSQKDLDSIRALGDLLPKSQRSWLMRDTPFASKLEKRDNEVAEDKLRGIIDIVRDPTFHTDSADLREIGVKAGVGFDIAVHKWQDYYFNTYKPIVDKYGAASKEGKAAKLARDRFKDKVFANVNGGVMVTGGLPERVLAVEYFTEPAYNLRSEGISTPEQQKLWGDYLAAARDPKTSPKKLKEYHDKFTPPQETRFAELRRTAHHVYIAGVALWMRSAMKQGYSEYYEGPGNSRYSNEGKRMVAKLEKLIRDIIREDKKLLGASAFARDMNRFFDSASTYASTALEWYAH